jgi:hypothetical protein
MQRAGQKVMAGRTWSADRTLPTPSLELLFCEGLPQDLRPHYGPRALGSTVSQK